MSTYYYYYFTWIIYVYYMPLSGFTRASCYTWVYVTSRRECNSPCFHFLLLLCLCLKVAAILLRSQPTNTAVILNISLVLHTKPSYWDSGMPSSFNRRWTCPVNKFEYAAGSPFWPTENSHCIVTVIASS